MSAITRPSEEDRDAQVGEARVVVDGGFDLGGEFASWFEHKRPQRTVLGEAGENWQGECSGLARSRLGGAYKVAPRHQGRDSAKLDRSGVGVAGSANAFEHSGRETEFGKWHGVFSGV